MKRKKYQFGTEDGIDPITGKPVIKGTSNGLGVNIWDVNKNPNMPNPNNPVLYTPDSRQGTPVNQGNPVPLSQFYDIKTNWFGNKDLVGTNTYVNDEGQVNTAAQQQQQSNQISKDNISNAKRYEQDRYSAELAAGLGITGINALLNNRSTKRNQRTDLRRAIMQEVYAPTYNPYPQGNGSQAIMEDGGKLDKGNLQVTGGGKTVALSNSDHGNGMIEFKGNEHKDGGIDIQFGGQLAEVEDKEIGWVDNEGALNVFGKLKLPGTNQTFRKAAKDMAKEESKVDRTKEKYLNILNNSNPADKYQESAISTSKVMFKSLDKKSKELDEKKEALASYQELILNMVEEGYVDKNKMEYGGKVPKKPIYLVDGGGLGGPNKTIKKLKLSKNYTKNGRDLSKVKSVTLHKTAGNGNGENIVSGWNKDSRKASADFIIDKDGTINQVGELTDTKWHSGRQDVNMTSLGVEIVGSSADESDMTDAQYKALQRLHKEVFTPMGISPNDYFGHTQVNKKKGFDFANADSIKNVLSKAGISNEYTPNMQRYTNMNTNNAATQSNGPGDRYPTAFNQFYDKKNKRQYNSPTGLNPSVFYKDATVVEALRLDQTYSKAIDDANWGPEHQKLWESLPQAKKDELLGKSALPSQPTAQPSASTPTPLYSASGFEPVYQPTGTGNTNVDTPYGQAARSATMFSDDVNIGNGERTRGILSPLALSQIAPELLTVATNRRDTVNQLSYQPELKQTFDISYQLGRNENQSTFNQTSRLAEMSGNIDALSQLAAQKYNADQQYNNQEVQGNATQRLGVYGQNIDTLNDAKLKNLTMIDNQQVRIAQSKFNTRKENISALTSMSSKVLQNQLENRTYNAYANLFKHYGFDKNGNVTFKPDDVVRKFTEGEASQFGVVAAQQGANSILNGDFSRQFTKRKNEDGSTTTTEILGRNKLIQDKYKALKNQGFDDSLIGNMLRAEFPETINQD